MKKEPDEPTLAEHERRELDGFERAGLREMLRDYRRRKWLRGVTISTIGWMGGGIALFAALRDELVSFWTWLTRSGGGP